METKEAFCQYAKGNQSHQPVTNVFPSVCCIVNGLLVRCLHSTGSIAAARLVYRDVMIYREGITGHGMRGRTGKGNGLNEIYEVMSLKVRG